MTIGLGSTAADVITQRTLPDGWQNVRLTDVARLESGHTPSKRNPQYWSGGVPWISLHDTEALDAWEIQATNQTITEAGLANSSARLLPKGTVVFSRTATVGKSTVMGRDMATSQDFACYVCGPRVHNFYLALLLRSMRSEWKKLMAGSIHNTVYMPVFKNLAVDLPPHDEQVAIAEAMLDVDKFVESLEQLLTKKRQIKHGAMQELLTGKRRLPGFKGRWQSLPLNALAKIQRGASPRPIDDPIWFDDSSSVGWVRISDVTQSGIYLHTTTQRLSEAGIRKSRFVRAGNLVMSICATVGRPIITALDTCIHDGFVVFDALSVDKKFLYYALLSIEDKWSMHGQTGSQMNLNTGLIKRAAVPVPDDVREQAAIAEVLSDIDADIAALEARLTKARALKEAMSQALLTGRIRLVRPAA